MNKNLRAFARETFHSGYQGALGAGKVAGKHALPLRIAVIYISTRAKRCRTLPTPLRHLLSAPKSLVRLIDSLISYTKSLL